MDKQTKRILILNLLVIMLISNLLTPLYANSNKSVYSNTLGTNIALGSPLLNNSSWGVEDWNKWELVTFGIFMSNFCKPFLDTYETAFTPGKGGSDGKGKEAFVFASGNDPSTNAIIDTLIAEGIKVAHSADNLKEIKVKFTYVDWTDKYTETIGEHSRASKVLDIFIDLDNDNNNLNSSHNNYSWMQKYVFTGNSSDLKVKENRIYNESENAKNEYHFEALKKANLPTFYVEIPNVNGQIEEYTILDFKNGWDLQIISALLGSVHTWKEDAMQNLSDAIYNQLWLDGFGNIVTILNGRPIVVIPASANQYLTTVPKYNMLNQVVLNNYTEATDDAIALGLLGGNNYLMGGDAFSSGTTWNRSIAGGGTMAFAVSNTVGKNKLIIGQDTDIALTQYLKKRDGKITEDIYWSDLDWGSVLYNTTYSNLSSDNRTYPFKIEVVGATSESWWTRLTSGTVVNENEGVVTRSEPVESYLVDLLLCTSTLSNLYPTVNTVEMLNYIYTNDTNTTPLFTSHSFVSNNLKGGEDDDDSTKNTGSSGVRRYVNYFFKYIHGNQQAMNSKLNPSILGDNRFKIKSPSTISNELKTSNYEQLITLMYTGDYNNSKFGGQDVTNVKKVSHYKPSPLFLKFIGDKYANLSQFNMEAIYDYPIYKMDNLKGSKLIDTNGEEWSNDQIIKSLRRVVKVYEINSSMRIASNILNAKEGTMFESFTPWIYLTYLDWYGITPNGGSEFYERLFDTSSLDFDISSLDEYVTEEDKKKSLINYAYIFMDVEKGREYRNQLVTSSFEDWAHKQYLKITTGNSLTSNITNTIKSNASQGFLKISTYADNWFTSYFMKEYSNNMWIIMMIFLILIIIIAVIAGHKMTWIVTSLMAVISILLILPSIAEIAPYISDRVVQKMFSENMSYWAVSESIENYTIEKEFNGSDKDDEVAKFVKMLNIQHLDKTIMIKNDISKKIIPTTSIDYDRLQTLQSTRWLIPILIRQFSSSDGSYDYVYSSLGDLYDNMSRMYWYNADHDLDRTSNNTYTSNTYVEPDRQGVNDWGTSTIPVEGDKRDFIFEGYKATYNKNGYTDYRSLSRANGDGKNSHTYFYLLDNVNFTLNDPITLLDYKEGYSSKMWDLYMQSITYNNTTDYKGYDEKITDVVARRSNADMGELKTISDLMFSQLNTYSLSEKGIPQQFGYLWSTESPAHYFYQVVKDTFGPDTSLPILAAELQGYYSEGEDVDGDGVKDNYRHTFMHWSENGEVRDFLDLEELFTNMIPYLYQMQLLAGGDNTENGTFKDELLGDKYSIYKDNLKSWIFRSNWATKIIENTMFSNKSFSTVYDPIDKVEVKLENSLYPHNYPGFGMDDPTNVDDPKPRKMVFSRAQMKYQGLTEKDLTYAELKMLNINDKVEQSWTLLLNHITSKGMSSEVMQRQMAINALLIFNQEMTADNLMSSADALYPTSLDLRNISFDSVMKLILLSSTGNSNYIYNDTMKVIISDSSIFGVLLLLTNAALCSGFIPFLRDLVMAFILYLMILAMIKAVISDADKRKKVAIGFIFNIVIFSIMTIAYYYVFAILIKGSNANNVLKVSAITNTLNIPIWKFIIILAANLVYILGVYKLMNLVWRNKYDLGYEEYMSFLSSTYSNLGNKIASIRNGNKNYSTNTTYNGESTLKKSKDGEPLDVKVVEGEVELKESTKKYKDNDSYRASNNTGDGPNHYENMTSSDFDNEIKKGKKMD